MTPFTDEIYLLDNPSFTPYTSDAYLKSIASLVKEHQLSILVGGATSTGKDLFPRLGVHLQTGYAPDCTGLSIGDGGNLVAKRPLYGGKVFAVLVFSEAKPQMATVRNNATMYPSLSIIIDTRNAHALFNLCDPEPDQIAPRISVCDKPFAAYRHKKQWPPFITWFRRHYARVGVIRVKFDSWVIYRLKEKSPS